MSETAVLSCEDISAGYGRVVAARNISISLERARILALLGPNGAGKTTLLLTLAGFLPLQAGTMRLDGERVKKCSARRMNAAGVVLVPDSRALFMGLTALENLSLGARAGGRSVDDVLDLFPALRSQVKLRAGVLSGGEQQMLAVARALVQRPRVLLIDELSMGLAPIVVSSLMPVLRQVADEADAAIVLVEQHVHLALEVADTAMVMVHGAVALLGPASEIREDVEALEAAYLGLGNETAYPEAKTARDAESV